MTGWDIIDRASVLRTVAAAGLTVDSETCQSGNYVRLDLDWIRSEFIPWILRNKHEPRGDGFRCLHATHWLLNALTESAYAAGIPHSHACARVHLVTPARDAHAVGLILATNGELYVLDPQDPELVPLACYPVLSWGRVRFL